MAVESSVSIDERRTDVLFIAIQSNACMPDKLIDAAYKREIPVIVYTESLDAAHLADHLKSNCSFHTDFATALYDAAWAKF